MKRLKYDEDLFERLMVAVLITGFALLCTAVLGVLIYFKG